MSVWWPHQTDAEADYWDSHPDNPHRPPLGATAPTNQHTQEDTHK